MTQQIFQSTLKTRAKVIYNLEVEIDTLWSERKAWTAQGELAFAEEARKQARKEESKLRKLVALQKATKLELHAIYRKERIAKLMVLVFGHGPQKQMYTTVEQLHMLETLYAEKQAEAVEAPVFE